MQRLSDKQLASATILGQRLIRALRGGRLPVPHSESFTDCISVRIPAAAAEVGDLEISDSGGEYTLSIGHHTHSHYTPELFEDLAREAQEAAALELLLSRLDSIVRDRVVIWSDGRSGGTFSLGAKPELISPQARGWLWSGKSYRLSG